MRAMQARRTLLATALLLAGVFASLPAGAEPAPWYLWQSTLNNRLVCAQTSPGKGWAQVRGPFRDAGCRKAAV